MELLEDTSIDPKGGPPTAPVINFEPDDSAMLQLEVPLDVVCVLGLETPLEEVAGKIKEGVCAQIRAITDVIRWKVRLLKFDLCEGATYCSQTCSEHYKGVDVKYLL